MGILITPADGYKDRTIQPRDGKKYTLEELYEHVGCRMVELVVLADGSYMWIDEEAKVGPDSPKPRNHEATFLLWFAGGDHNDYISGNAFVTRADEVD